jgi:hypothetical protein
MLKKKTFTTTGLLAVSVALALPSMMQTAHAATTPISQANDTIFGPNVYVFDPSMSSSDIQNTANNIYNQMQTNEFAGQGYAMLFKPGSYNENVKEGFYTQVSGLGLNPSDVTINGNVSADAQYDNGNATDNFWRSVENITVDPTAGAVHNGVDWDPTGMQWAVSQEAPIRRVHVEGNLDLFDFTSTWGTGYASGGFMADSIVDGKVTPASQQQWLSRNNQYGSWSNGVWNMVFVGDKNPPSGTWPTQPYTTVSQTPEIAEEPYLYVDANGNYNVFVPSLEKNTQGVSWANGSTSGTSLAISKFFIAFPSTPVKQINQALDRGMNLIFTPGTYNLDETIQVKRANTIVMGLGFPTLVASNGQQAMTVGDVGGVRISGLIVDAGAKKTTALMTIGTPLGGHMTPANNPTILYDMTYRVGGARVGTTDTSLVINSDNVIGDDLWLWRADHGTDAGWNENVDENGLVVNGDNVTMYGLANEHHEQYQTLWNGNGGKVYFYQSEDPYDVPNQASWMSHDGTVNGYASYKVSPWVTSNQVYGIGVYSYFRDAAVSQNSAIEVPNYSGIKIQDATTVWLNGQTGSSIDHIVNNTGDAATNTTVRQTLANFEGTITLPNWLTTSIK